MRKEEPRPTAAGMRPADLEGSDIAEDEQASVTRAMWCVEMEAVVQSITPNLTRKLARAPTQMATITAQVAQMATMLMNMMNEGCIHNVNLFIATIAI
eukprot:COSAG05_NODE_156_length_15696_cov_359.955440_17_plen_98_part_00